jgi:putative ABC transport system permease protein
MMAWLIAWRFARRELRGGIKGFRIFIACLALGVAAIAGVGSLATGIVTGLEFDGRALLGGDVEVRLTHRAAGDAERQWLDQRGTVSEIAQMRAIAFQVAGDRRTLVELKAVDRAYPLFGSATLNPAGDLQNLLAVRSGLPGAVVDDLLLGRLAIKPGDRIRVGEAQFEVRAVLSKEPDRATDALSIGPRVMIALDGLRATGLLAPGSLVAYEYRVALPPGVEAAPVAREATAAFPDAGWRVRTWRNANPGLQQFIDRVGLFMVLIGLTALLVGGVGVGNAVKSYLDGKTATIATLKCLSAEGGLIFRTYLVQVLMLASFGIVLGLLIGSVLPWLLVSAFGDLLPIAVKMGLYARPLAFAALYGVLIALAFALWPLALAREVVPAGLFRDLVAPTRRWPRPIYIAATAVTVLALAAIAILTTDEKRFAIWFVLGAAGSFVVLRGVAEGLMYVARQAGRPRIASLRFGLANLHRPGAPTASVVLSLGLGLTLLVAVALIQGNLGQQVQDRLPGKAPAFFFIDIQLDQAAAFEATVRAVPGAGDVEKAPSLRGRITRVKDVPADRVNVSAEQRWVIRGDRGITYSADMPPNSTLVEGKWWPRDYAGENLVSMEAEAARGMGLQIGDSVTVNVLGREIEAKVANLRRVEWGGFSINYVMVFSPNALAGAPHTMLATAKAEPQAEEAIFRAVTDGFPNISAIRIKDALDQVNTLLGQIGLAIRAAAGVTLLAGVLVLAGAIIAGRRARTKDAVLLKVLGATRADVLRIMVVEYALLGLVTAVIAGAIGWLAAWLVVTQVMRMEWVALPGALVSTALLSMLATVVLGLAGTWRTLSQSPAPILRQN